MTVSGERVSLKMPGLQERGAEDAREGTPAAPPLRPPPAVSRGKILLIGQAPSRSGDPSRPLEGRVGKRLASLMGVSAERYLELTERMNLLEFRPGRNGKGDAWDSAAARRRADDLKLSLSDRAVVLLGRNVARAFGLADLPWLTLVGVFGCSVGVVPHPSGIVLWWNDAENRRKASDFLRGLLAAVESGGHGT